jgi:uncharacterized metal-binding protein/predicted Fe-Mo cluster-binding NifX family protein
MRYAIPLLGGRIAPRCTIAESLLVVETHGGRDAGRRLVSSPGNSWPDLISVLVEEGVDALVCGGIAQPAREELKEQRIAVVNNVAATAEAVVDAILGGRLQPGFGFGTGETRPPQAGGEAVLDCLACRNRICLQGQPCPLLPRRPKRAPRERVRRTLEAAADISGENERVLCRLSELIYFGLETGRRRLGVAFCWDLLEPTRILVGVLRRFFEVVPVGCRVGGAGGVEGVPSAEGSEGEDERPVACDPLGQARALADASCELNVMVGLCIGADCLFTRASRAMVTTLVVKDRSLAHNPIGALYSDRYLKEALLSSIPANA